eukprot:230522-Pleurochrysis_carterae.AAC.2
MGKTKSPAFIEISAEGKETSCKPPGLRSRTPTRKKNAVRRTQANAQSTAWEHTLARARPQRERYTQTLTRAYAQPHAHTNCDADFEALAFNDLDARIRPQLLTRVQINRKSQKPTQSFAQYKRQAERVIHACSLDLIASRVSRLNCSFKQEGKQWFRKRGRPVTVPTNPAPKYQSNKGPTLSKILLVQSLLPNRVDLHPHTVALQSRVCSICKAVAYGCSVQTHIQPYCRLVQ